MTKTKIISQSSNQAICIMTKNVDLSLSPLQRHVKRVRSMRSGIPGNTYIINIMSCKQKISDGIIRKKRIPSPLGD